MIGITLNACLKYRGSMLLSIKESINVKLPPDLYTFINEEFEMIFVEMPVIYHTNKSLLLGVVYRSPSADIDKFMFVLMIC